MRLHVRPARFAWLCGRTAHTSFFAVVYDGNEGAFALYKRLGFQVQSSPKSARFFAQYGSTGSRVMRFTRLDDYAAPEPHIPEVEVAALRRSAAVMRDSLDEDAPP